MNGVHDLGGGHGHGAVAPDPHETAFHAPWERRVFGLTLAMGATGAWNLDMSRAARESIPPALYLSGGYYRIWLEGLVRLSLGCGLVDAAELASGRSARPGLGVRRLAAADVSAALLRGTPTHRHIDAPARFSPGEAVRARNMNPATHTRIPRYVRGRRGVVEAIRGAHVFPDTHAQGQGEQPQWLYTVRFEADELWGADTTASAVYVDLWESYLE